jgi:hypothetical protein
MGFVFNTKSKEYQHMSNKFFLITNDNDVINIEEENGDSVAQEHTFKISDFRKSVQRDLRERLIQYIFRKINPNPVKYQFAMPDIRSTYAKELKMDYGRLFFHWQSSETGIPCKLLQIGSSGWQPGKFRTQADVEIFPEEENNSDNFINIEVTVEFSPDVPEDFADESSLDDIRRMEKAN